MTYFTFVSINFSVLAYVIVEKRQSDVPSALRHTKPERENPVQYIIISYI